MPQRGSLVRRPTFGPDGRSSEAMRRPRGWWICAWSSQPWPGGGRCRRRGSGTRGWRSHPRCHGVPAHGGCRSGHGAACAAPGGRGCSPDGRRRTDRPRGSSSPGCRARNGWAGCPSVPSILRRLRAQGRRSRHASQTRQWWTVRETHGLRCSRTMGGGTSVNRPISFVATRYDVVRIFLEPAKRGWWCQPPREEACPLPFGAPSGHVPSITATGPASRRAGR